MTNNFHHPGPVAGRGKPSLGLRRTRLAFDPIAAALRQLHGRPSSDALPDDFLRLLDRLGEAAPNGHPA